MLKAVLDTNVLVSGFSSLTGAPGLIYDAWKNNRFELVVSEYILGEFIKTINAKFNIPQENLLDYLEDIYYAAEMVKEFGIEIKEVMPNDWPILGTAIAGYVDFLVTGDKKLLAIKHFHGIAIIAPAEFLKILNS